MGSGFRVHGEILKRVLGVANRGEDSHQGSREEGHALGRIQGVGFRI